MSDRPTASSLLHRQDTKIIIEVTLGIIVAVALMIGACLVYSNIHRPSPNTTGKLDQLGSFIGGISLFFTVLVIWFEASLIRNRNSNMALQTKAVDSFRLLYDEFW